MLSQFRQSMVIPANAGIQIPTSEMLGLALIVWGYGDASAMPVALGLAAYLGFAIYLHPLLIGVRVW